MPKPTLDQILTEVHHIVDAEAIPMTATEVMAKAKVMAEAGALTPAGQGEQEAVSAMQAGAMAALEDKADALGHTSEGPLEVLEPWKTYAKADCETSTDEMEEDEIAAAAVGEEDAEEVVELPVEVAESAPVALKFKIIAPTTAQAKLVAKEARKAFKTRTILKLRANMPFPYGQYLGNTTFNRAETQKARGLLYLGDRWTQTELDHVLSIPSQVLVLPGAIAPFQHLPVGEFPVFCRPCPLQPVHGGIPSQPMANFNNIFKLLERVQGLYGKRAELILMPRLTGEWSAVLTGAGITLGKGHAGATDPQGGLGVQKAIKIPAAVVEKRWMERFAPNKVIRATLGLWDSPYLELVENKGMFMVVQLRNGTAEPRSSNYVPKTFTPRKILAPGWAYYDLLRQETARNQEIIHLNRKGVVIVPAPSLMAWDQTLKSRVPGRTLVWLPNQPLSCHWAVQAIEAGYAVSTGSYGSLPQPKRAIQATKAGKVRQEISKNGYHDIAARIVYRLLEGWDDAVHDNATEGGQRNNGIIAMTVGTLHAQAFWPDAPPFNRLRAEGLAVAAVWSLIACFGELRHYYGCGPGESKKFDDESEKGTSLYPAKTDFDAVMGQEEYHEQAMYKALHGDGPHQRTKAYELLKDRGLKVLLDHAETMLADFRQPGWNGSYGGPKWAASTEASILMATALVRFLKKPEQKQWKALLTAYNNVVNVSHNGGKLLSKWCHGYVFDLLADVPALGFCNTYVCQIVFGAGFIVTNDKRWKYSQQFNLKRLEALDKSARATPPSIPKEEC